MLNKAARLATYYGNNVIGRNSMNLVVYKEILTNIHPLKIFIVCLLFCISQVKMSDTNVIPNNLVTIRKRQFEHRQDEWFSARWMVQNAEQTLTVAREYARVTTERKLQAERELEEAREAEFRQSRAGQIRTREGVVSNLRRSLQHLAMPSAHIAEAPPQEAVAAIPLPPVSTLLPRVFSAPPASPDSITPGEPVATSTPLAEEPFTQLLTPPPQYRVTPGLTVMPFSGYSRAVFDHIASCPSCSRQFSSPASIYTHLRRCNRCRQTFSCARFSLRACLSDMNTTC